MNKKMLRMLETINFEAQETAAFTGREVFSETVMTAMSEVPREKFVPASLKAFAYDNGPLSIGYGQTISQPYIVALMTDLLDVGKHSHVLEIGTGSGYQAAILSRIVAKVYSIEKIPELAEAANRRFKALGYTNIETRCCNGYKGWQEKSPFDAIIVTAAATHIPPALTEQLKPGGRMVIPVGPPYMTQELMLVSKNQDGSADIKTLLSVAFVPLIVDESDAGEGNQ